MFLRNLIRPCHEPKKGWLITIIFCDIPIGHGMELKVFWESL